VAAGLAVLAGAWLTGHRDVVLRRPVLDGFAPPPPYRWVSPPPDLAQGNQRPESVSTSVGVFAGRSKAATVSTPDLQASLFLVQDAMALPPGTTAVRVTISPRAPTSEARLPEGLEFAGNVYDFTARAEPGNQSALRLRREATVVLVYPAEASDGSAEPVMLTSPDGSTWVRVRTNAAQLQHQAAANVRALGLFAVGRRRQPTGGGFPQGVRVAVFVLLLAAAAAAAVLGWRRRRPSGSNP